ncbi:MAG: pyruvate kinase [Mogibacterium sp.]|nr:pyruvate kinase [Mogibacterium sp.]
MRKTKIVCTMGPRESDKAILAELAKEMDVARFNFSHGTHESQLEMLKAVRQAAKEAGRPIAALLDTKGPEIRTGLLAGDQAVKIVKGSKVVISPMHNDELTDSEHIYVTYEDIAQDLKPGDAVLIDDGAIELTVESINGESLECKVITGGYLGARKGVNLPGVKVGLPGITDKDIEDITFGLENDFDYIAASFIRDAATIEKIRKMITDAGAKTKIIAKIESKEGIDNLDEIIDAADGVMVARGDLGVEVEAKCIPQLQREMIARCNETGKIVITATQMLDSMIRNPRPTRAEVTDVANAVYEGSDAIMLSGETASGDYPVEALRMMVSIAEYTEQFLVHQKGGLMKSPELDEENLSYKEVLAIRRKKVAETTCIAGVTAAEELHAKVIITPTSSGLTALQMSKCRPTSDIYAFSPDPAVVRQMMLYWGVRPYLAEMAESTDALLDDCIDILSSKEVVEKGDLCVFIAGVVSGKRKSQRSETNTMRIIEI